MLTSICREACITRDKGGAAAGAAQADLARTRRLHRDQGCRAAGSGRPPLPSSIWSSLPGVDGPPVRHQMAERDKEKVLYSVWKTIIDYVEDRCCGGESLNAILRHLHGVMMARSKGLQALSLAVRNWQHPVGKRGGRHWQLCRRFDGAPSGLCSRQWVSRCCRNFDGQAGNTRPVPHTSIDSSNVPPCNSRPAICGTPPL